MWGGRFYSWGQNTFLSFRVGLCYKNQSTSLVMSDDEVPEDELPFPIFTPLRATDIEYTTLTCDARYSEDRRNTHEYSLQDLRYTECFFAQNMALLSCIQGLLICDCPILIYRRHIDTNRLHYRVFGSIDSLHTDHKSWTRASLADIRRSVESHETLACENKIRDSNKDIHDRMCEYKRTWNTIKIHIRKTVGEISVKSEMNLKSEFECCERWMLQYPNTRKSYEHHVDANLCGNDYIGVLKSRIDDLRHGYPARFVSCISTTYTGIEDKIWSNPSIEIIFQLLRGCTYLRMCRYMIRISYLLESIENEIQDMISEFSAWKKLSCAMALHPRSGSMLGSVGCDVMQMIIKNLWN